MLAWYYLRWHYTQALVELAGIVSNFVWFFTNFFSLRLLLHTFAMPFHRLSAERSEPHELPFWLEAFIVNTLMRFVGMLFRTFLILLCVIVLVVTIVLGAVFLFAWLLAPVLVAGALVAGVLFITL